MEGVNSVDVSWLHHSHKDQISRTKSASSAVAEKTNGPVDPSHLKALRKFEQSPPAKDKPSPSLNAAVVDTPKQNGKSTTEDGLIPFPDMSQNFKTDKGAEPHTQPPVILSKGSAPRNIPNPRRTSWISSISSRFSSGTTPPLQHQSKENGSAKALPPPTSTPPGVSSSPKEKEEKTRDQSSATHSTSPKGGPGFLSSAFRRLSSGSSNMGKMSHQGIICQRRVMNVDPGRDRCRVPDLDPSKLKRVAFCVDVEIAGISRAEDDDTSKNGPRDLPQSHAGTPSSSKKAVSLKMKEQAEGAALKEDVAKQLAESAEKSTELSKKNSTEALDESGSPDSPSADANGESKKEPTRKQEKKKRSEEERKERKERKRRQAEANGSVPLQIKLDDEASTPTNTSRASTPARSEARSERRSQNSPTTDPLRIYRRCCQLRETPVLKKLVERMTAPSSTSAESPGTVAVLDLTDFPMTIQDIVTFSDWLAIVPVRKLIMENCALTDEGLRTILAGLLSTKTMEQARNSRRRAKKSASRPVRRLESFGVIERLSLKNNPRITAEGWRHICLFVHLSKSLRALDLSGIKFPATISVNQTMARPGGHSADIATTFASALANRFGGDRLEELLLGECKPSAEDVGKICDAAISFGLRRLGLANNSLSREALAHVVRYLDSGKCEGVDLGGNDFGDHLDILTPTLNKTQQLLAISLADCALTPSSVSAFFKASIHMPSLRFVDLSHNRALFATQPDALGTLRRYLPQMKPLKRIHLADVDLSPDHLIALAEILPECPSLCHLSVLENTQIVKLTSATDPASQEEACAVYASLMAATRVSRTIIAIDIEVPSAESSEVVKALASQIVAYSLRNLEQRAMDEEFTDSSDPPSHQVSQVLVPEVLQHIVGPQIAGGSDEKDEPAADDDYVLGGTGVVKALGVCLGNVENRQSGLDSPRLASGVSTPVQDQFSPGIATKKPRDMSKNLLDSARNIRTRIQSALVREDQAGHETNYRRLQFLDVTLFKIIRRFEDEYPETRIEESNANGAADTSSQHSTEDTQDSPNLNGSPPTSQYYDEHAVDDEDADEYAVRLSRSGSNTSLHSRLLTSEEGRIHRLGQNIRREFLSPSGDRDQNAKTSSGTLDDSHVVALREKLAGIQGDEIRARVESVGPDKALAELGSTVEELWHSQKQNSDIYEEFKAAQIAAQINGGLRLPESASESGDSGFANGKMSSDEE